MEFPTLERRSILKPVSQSSLSAQDGELLAAAYAAQETSHSPYSHFAVGAALRLKDKTIVKGSNQENAAYPSGLCAERTALFFAGAQYPGVPIEKMAVVVPQGTQHLAVPCGACLQVLAEYQAKQNQAIEILLKHPQSPVVYCAEGVQHLLPFAFGKDNLQKG